eukprot:403376305
MNFNSLFFPAPQKSYSYLTFYNELIYIPKNITKNLKTIVSYIPCLFIPYKPKRNGQITQQYLKDKEFRDKTYKNHKLLIYFHGNAEDIGHSYEFLNSLSDKFHLNILSMEYPGYGIYRNEEADSETISLNAQIVFDYVTQSLKFDPKDIILFGRSMGSGPACQISEISKPAALILLSPYTSLRDAVKSILGSIPSLLVKERFKNLDVIQRVTCPTLIVHGQSDTLIPFSHSQQLHINCGGPSKLIMPKKMTHNEFDLHRDLFEPVKQFFIESNLLTSCVRGQVQTIKEKYFAPPRNMRDQQGTQNTFSQESNSDNNQLKQSKSTPQLVPLIMTTAYQHTLQSKFEDESLLVLLHSKTQNLQNKQQSSTVDNRILQTKKFPLSGFEVTKSQQRDKSPVPQSEEKLKLEIRDSVKAKNMNGIDVNKRIQLSKSVKENAGLHHPSSFKIGPKTSRALVNQNKQFFLASKSNKGSFQQPTGSKNEDTDNTIIQDEARRGDALNIKIWKTLFDRKGKPQLQDL